MSGIVLVIVVVTQTDKSLVLRSSASPREHREVIHIIIEV